MDEMTKTYEDRLNEANSSQKAEEAKRAAENEARNSGRPQLMNLNEDGMLDRKIFIDLSKVTSCSVGRRTGDPTNDPTLVLGGIGIEQQHALFETDAKKGTTIKALSESAAKFIFINGEALKNSKPVTLKPNDRIIFGTSSCFLFRNQDKKAEAKVQDTPEEPITNEFAMKEKLDNSNKAEAAQKEQERLKMEEETAKKLGELNSKMDAERAKQEAERTKMQAEFEAKMSALNAEIQTKNDDAQAKKEA